jgi:hypothetical protein
MKTKMLIVGLCLMMMSCKKEETCNCGTITEDGISFNSDGSTCYWLEVRNDCSGNKERWCFDYDVWFDGNPGENFCVTNVESW